MFPRRSQPGGFRALNLGDRFFRGRAERRAGEEIWDFGDVRLVFVAPKDDDRISIGHRRHSVRDSFF